MRHKKEQEKKKRIIYSFQRRPGLIVVEVPVSDNPDIGKAIVNAKTWNTLVSLGMRPDLSVTPDGYVVCRNHEHTYKRLARLIANCNSDQQVTVKDGNELNLLEENLEIINQDPVTNDRQTFLTTEYGTFNNDVEYKVKGAPEPKPYNDAEIVEALGRNPNYQEWLHQQRRKK